MFIRIIVLEKIFLSSLSLNAGSSLVKSTIDMMMNIIIKKLFKRARVSRNRNRHCNVVVIKRSLFPTLYPCTEQMSHNDGYHSLYIRESAVLQNPATDRDELLKNQQQTDNELLKVQKERQGGIQNPARERE